MNRIATPLAAIVVASASPALAQAAPPANSPEQAQAIADLLRIITGQSTAPATPSPTAAGPATGPGVVEGSTVAGADAAKVGPAAPKFAGPTGKIAIGTLAAGTLSTTVISDYPGPWKGTLTQPIYTIDRKNVLFPEGTVVVGRVARVGGVNEAINNRLALIPTELVRPDGMAFKINQNAITDDAGTSGLTDKVDFHLGAQAAAIGAFGIIGAAPDLVREIGGAGASNNQVLDLSSQQAGFILQKYLALVPTVTVRAGTRFQVFFVEEVEAPLGHTRAPFQLTNYKRGQ